MTDGYGEEFKAFELFENFSKAIRQTRALDMKRREEQLGIEPKEVNQIEEDRGQLIIESATRGLHIGQVEEVKKMLADNPYNGSNILITGWRIYLEGEICFKEQKYAQALSLFENAKEIYEDNAKDIRDANINLAVIYIWLSDTHRRLSEQVADKRNYHLNRGIFFAKKAQDKFNTIEEMDIQYLIAGKRFVDIEIEMSIIEKNADMLRIDLALLEEYLENIRTYTDYDVHNPFMYGTIISISYVLCVLGRSEEAITVLKEIKPVQVVPGFDDDRLGKILGYVFHSKDEVRNEAHKVLWKS